MRRKTLLGSLAVLLALAGCVSSPAGPATSVAESPGPVSITAGPSSATPAPLKGYRVLKVFPHDPGSFTEGLVLQNGELFESSGRYGQSELLREDLASGKVLQAFKLADSYFAEGLTAYRDQLVQLTYESQVGFIYDVETFALEKVFSYGGEGWGITSDGQRLIVSDGGSNLQFWDPANQRLTGSIQVKDAGKPVELLNELEYVRGRVYANVWKSDRIAIINPEDGRVETWVNLAGLLQSTGFSGEVDVLNGIAYDALNDRLYVTGKLWPYLFQIEVLP